MIRKFKMIHKSSCRIKKTLVMLCIQTTRATKIQLDFSHHQSQHPTKCPMTVPTRISPMKKTTWKTLRKSLRRKLKKSLKNLMRRKNLTMTTLRALLEKGLVPLIANKSRGKGLVAVLKLFSLAVEILFNLQALGPLKKRTTTTKITCI